MEMLLIIDILPVFIRLEFGTDHGPWTLLIQFNRPVKRSGRVSKKARPSPWILWKFSLNFKTTRVSVSHSSFQRLRFCDECNERVRPHQIQHNVYSCDADVCCCCQHDWSVSGCSWTQSKGASLASQGVCIQHLVELDPFNSNRVVVCHKASQCKLTALLASNVITSWPEPKLL